MKIIEWGRLRNENDYFLTFTCGACGCVYLPKTGDDLEAITSHDAPRTITYVTTCPVCSYTNTRDMGMAKR